MAPHAYRFTILAAYAQALIAAIYPAGVKFFIGSEAKDPSNPTAISEYQHRSQRASILTRRLV